MLTTEQLQAVEAINTLAQYGRRDESVTVEAPAGAGKTTLIVEAVTHMATRPRVITFTRRAAAELRARGCDATTIYALAAEHMQDQDLARVVTEDVEDLIFRRWSERWQLDRFNAKRLWPLQGPRLLATEDMLQRLPREDRLWIVDEAQDCTEAEIAHIQRCARTVAWVGDPWQRIYEWRGAVGMPCVQPHRLTLNHRSDCNIVARAAEISGRHEVTAGATAPNGLTAWLCRGNREARKISEALGCHLVSAPDRTALALLQVEAAAALGCDWAQAYREWPSWTAAVNAASFRLPGVDLRTPRTFLIWLRTHDLQDQVSDHSVQAMTIHAAKGLQFEEVNLVGWPSKCEEDRRLHYVAVTRATHRLREFRDLEAALIGGGK